MKSATLLLALAACAIAQSARISGTVRELPDRNPIAAVQVTLTAYEGPDENRKPVAIGTVYTGNDGAYEFRSLKPGFYTVEVAKPGYWWGEVGGRSMTETGGLNASVTEDGSKITVDLTMLRPAKLSGRVEDSDGNPIAGLQLGLARPSTPDFPQEREATDAEGRFVFSRLIAGPYLVRIGPTEVFFNALRNFAEEDIVKIDEDYQVSFWPGGSTGASAALPVNVPSGGDIDIGRLRPRRVPLYRARLSLRNAECAGRFASDCRGLRPSRPTPSRAPPNSCWRDSPPSATASSSRRKRTGAAPSSTRDPKRAPSRCACNPWSRSRAAW